MSSAFAFFFLTIGGPLVVGPPGRPGARGGSPVGPVGGGRGGNPLGLVSEGLPDPGPLPGPVGALTGGWFFLGNPDPRDVLSWLTLGSLALSELLVDSSRLRLASVLPSTVETVLIVGIVCASSSLPARRWRALSRCFPN